MLVIFHTQIMHVCPLWQTGGVNFHHRPQHHKLPFGSATGHFGDQITVETFVDNATESNARLADTALIVGVGGWLYTEDVVKVGVYMKDMGDRDAFNKVWKETFGDEPPARFAVQVVDMGVIGDKTKFLLDVTALAPEA